MPGRYEKIRLNEKQDRRRKLTQEQKDEIVRLYGTGHHGLRSLGRQFGVNKSCIKILVDPERAATVKSRAKSHWRDYAPTKDERSATMRKHRHYKRDLYQKGELGMGDFTMKRQLVDYLRSWFESAECGYCVHHNERSEKTPCPNCTAVTREYAHACGEWQLSKGRAEEMADSILKLVMWEGDENA